MISLMQHAGESDKNSHNTHSAKKTRLIKVLLSSLVDKKLSCKNLLQKIGSITCQKFTG